MTDFRFAHGGYIHRTVSRDEVDHGSTTFDLVDKRGRQIGFSWGISKLVTRPETDDERVINGWGSFFKDTDTVRFVGHTHPTRNGKRYGASTPSIYGKTLEEVRQAVVARAAACEKRYAKLVAKGGV